MNKTLNSRKFEFLMGLAFLLGVFLISRHAGMLVSGQNVMARREKPVVVIDSGQGTSYLRTNWVKKYDVPFFVKIPEFLVFQLHLRIYR